MLSWLRKKPKQICEHEWHIVRESSFVSDYELYCPKCKENIYVRTKEIADSYTKKSQLRNKYLEELKEKEGM